MNRRLRGALVTACAALGCLAAGHATAHVGSPDTWFEGHAGPYPIRVVVRAPGVVPGLAEIDVRVLGGTPDTVTVQPFVWNAGASGAPEPDVAKRVPGDPRLFNVQLWLMVPTSYGVHVTVGGREGRGTEIVPVQAVATQRLPMDRTLGWTLAALGLFLVAGLVTIAGAAVRESTLRPGVPVDAGQRARARIAVAASALLLVLGLIGGRAWWDGVDRAYATGIYRPLHASASVERDSLGARWVALAIDDPRWRGREWSPLIPDHGKLMHMFLVREGDLGAMAHLHPAPRDSDHFAARLPALPAGRYRVYADIVHETGFAQTLVDTLELGADSTAAAGAAAAAPSDPDDAWFVGSAAVAPDGPMVRFPLEDGSAVTRERGNVPIVERREQPLWFRVTAPDGTPAPLEPYLGMAAHAVVVRDDGAVFAHLHPTGTVSMAAQMALAMRSPADSLPGTLGRRLSSDQMMIVHAMQDSIESEFTIPYGFPKRGRYRMWVQVKFGGAVRTAAFDVEVKAEGS